MVSNHYFQILCDRVFALSPSIRFAGVIDRMGKLIAGGMRAGIQSMEEDSQKLYLEFALRSEMRKDFDTEFGKTIYSYSEREKIKLASFPLINDHVLRLSMERRESHNEVIKKTLDLIYTFTKEDKKL